MSKDQWFYQFCAAIDTPGGHMVAGFCLIILGAVLSKLFGLAEEGRGIIGAATGAMLAAMRGLNGRAISVKPAEPNPVGVTSTDTKTKT